MDIPCHSIRLQKMKMVFRAIDGAHLAKASRKITWLKPKAFRDRFTTKFRLLDFNQVNIELHMGRSLNN